MMLRRFVGRSQSGTALNRGQDTQHQSDRESTKITVFRLKSDPMGNPIGKPGQRTQKARV